MNEGAEAGLSNVEKKLWISNAARVFEEHVSSSWSQYFKILPSFWHGNDSIHLMVSKTTVINSPHIGVENDPLFLSSLCYPS